MGLGCWAFVMGNGLASMRPYLRWRRSLARRGDSLPPAFGATPGDFKAGFDHFRRFLGRERDADADVERLRQLARGRFLRSFRGVGGFFVVIVLAIVVNRL